MAEQIKKECTLNMFTETIDLFNKYLSEYTENTNDYNVTDIIQSYLAMVNVHIIANLAITFKMNESNSMNDFINNYYKKVKGNIKEHISKLNEIQKQN
jgi:hypothetical protein